MFLDEPTTYLDIRYQGELMVLIKQLQQDQGITVILVLHDITKRYR
ncbi:ABC transporter ATP-binding protein [Secundilactobacillus collinoides]|nr:ABC transporter ATP-binding protein [Secundilactobacillus collinoides]